MIQLSRFVLLAFAVAVGLQGCTGPKQLYKKGLQLEEASLVSEASEYYLSALARKRDHIESKIALKRTGQVVVNEGLSEFFQAQSADDHKTAVYTFREVQAFYNRADAFGVKLNLPEYHQTDYEKSLDTYLHDRYVDAMAALDEESFSLAQEITAEIKTLNPNYREIQDLNKRAIAEPRYREANGLMDAQKYRSAFYVFEEILDEFGTYRDAQKQRDYCLEKAQYKIAVLPFENTTDKKGYENAVGALVVQKIIDRNDPFIQLIDEAQIQEIAERQQLRPGPNTTSEYLMRMGSLAGAHAVLTGQLITMRLQPGEATSQRVKGYRSYVVNRVNPQTGEKYSETLYDKIYYNDHTHSNQVVLGFKYQLINSETGEILRSEFVQSNPSDAIHFATYDGDYRSIYPGFWNYLKKPHPEDKVYTSRRAYRDLQSLFEAPRKVKTIESLVGEGLQEIAGEIGNAVVEFNPDL